MSCVLPLIAFSFSMLKIINLQAYNSIACDIQVLVYGLDVFC